MVGNGHGSDTYKWSIAQHTSLLQMVFAKMLTHCDGGGEHASRAVASQAPWWWWWWKYGLVEWNWFSDVTGCMTQVHQVTTENPISLHQAVFCSFLWSSQSFCGLSVWTASEQSSASNLQFKLLGPHLVERWQLFILDCGDTVTLKENGVRWQAWQRPSRTKI